MASVVTSRVLSYFLTNSKLKPRSRVRVQSVSSGDSKGLPSDSVQLNGASLTGEEEKNGVLIDRGIREKEKTRGRVYAWNASLKCGVEKTCVKDVIPSDLDVLWDDGYGNKTVKDYFEEAKDMIRPDGGPPRWFCPVDCGQPLKDSPVLLFCPGLDGVGSALILHHKALGKVFEVRCLHIPVCDRTPFEGLVTIVQETVRLEHASSPNKPIYLLGDSFGGCLVLAVAARNPEIDLVVILANPATSFERSQLQPLFPLSEAWPGGLYNAVPYLLSCIMGDPVKMASVNIEHRLPRRLQIEQLFQNLIALLPCVSDLADIVPKDTLTWKLKLLKSAASYTNSRIHAVKAEVLVLSSGNDYMLPSGDEAQRLKSSLKNCTVRYFKDNGHTILLEDGVNLLTVIKGTGKYRHSKIMDFVTDFVPPSMSEFKYGYDELVGFLNFATGSAMFSTLDDGKIVKGLHGIPNDGPVLFVGNHMLMGLETCSLVLEFLRERNIMVRGVEHPVVLGEREQVSSPEFSFTDWMKVMGAVPVTASNLFKLLSIKSHVLLYPGGARESLHHRGEEYKLFWPDQPEFVRMAARFGATIVPFGTVGEDDIAELVLDYNDQMKIPVLNDYIRNATRSSIRIRDKSKGEVANQELYIPGLLPKLPGRFYFLFGKPIPTGGRKEEILKDRENANQLYLHIKSEVEGCIAYLLKKREEDPYRNIADRTVYRALHSPFHVLKSKVDS